MKNRAFPLISLLSILIPSAIAGNSFSAHITNGTHAESDIDLSINVVDLNDVGDCTIVKFGDTEILIDAGGYYRNSKSDRGGSPERIYNALNNLVSDGSIEYAIMTHADADHISSFADEYGLKKWMEDPGHKIGHLIDFDLLRDPSINSTNYPAIGDLFVDHNTSLLKVGYVDYATYRTLLLSEGKIEKYNTASQLCYKERGLSLEDVSNGDAYSVNHSNPSINTETSQIKESDANVFTLFSNPTSPSAGKTAKLTFLYNFFYDHPVDYYKGDNCSKLMNSAGNNIISVCSLIEYNSDKFLFTGDLEEYLKLSTEDRTNTTEQNMKRIYGETKLVEYNKELLSGGIKYYKAAHHGSATSNSSYLMDYIRPQYVGISAVADSRLDNSSKNRYYSFPDQFALNNITRWTDKIYITDKIDINETDNSNVQEYYGDICFNYSSANSIMEVTYTGNEPESILCSEWFNENRLFSACVYNLTDLSDYYNKSNYQSGNRKSFNEIFDTLLEKETLSPSQFECTLVKSGSFDILFNYGSLEGNNEAIETINNKVYELCNDGILECVVVNGSNDFQFNLVEQLLKGDSIKSVDEVLYYDGNGGETVYSKFIKNLTSNKEDAGLSKINSALALESKDIFEFELDHCDTNYHKAIKIDPVAAKNAIAKTIPVAFSINTYKAKYGAEEKEILNGSNFTYLNTGKITDFTSLILHANYCKKTYGELNLCQIPYFGRNEITEAKGSFTNTPLETTTFIGNIKCGVMNSMGNKSFGYLFPGGSWAKIFKNTKDQVYLTGWHYNNLKNIADVYKERISNQNGSIYARALLGSSIIYKDGKYISNNCESGTSLRIRVKLLKDDDYSTYSRNAANNYAFSAGEDTESTLRMIKGLL